MDKYLEELFNQMHDLCHRIQGYVDAKRDLKPNLRFVEDDEPKVLIFPTEKNSTLEKGGENKISGADQPDNATEILKFTTQEISKFNMDKTFKKVFIANGLVAHVIKRKSGKRTFYYEIRYRAHGYHIAAGSVDIRKAKEKFLFKTSPGEIEKYRIENIKKERDTLQEIFDEWYMIKDGTITNKALQRFDMDFSALPEKLKKTPIGKIRSGDIKNVMHGVKPRKYEELRTLFNGIFKYAIASGIITYNPVSMIKFIKAERQTRDALSEDEILQFLKKIEEPKYARIKQGAYLLYFFGLRTCEVDEEVRREGDFLIARNRKRKNGKIEYKKIPIPKPAEQLIDWNQPLTFGVTAKVYYEWFHEILGDKTPYNLRHTFATTCQQFVRPDIADIWMGDSPQRLVGRVYTHFPDKFMRKQMDTVCFLTLEDFEK